MSNINENKDNNRSDEVEFEPLIDWFLSFMSQLSFFFRKLFYSIWKGKAIIAAFLILAFVSGLVYMQFGQKKYEVRMTVKSNYIDNHTCYVLLNDLSLLVVDKSYNKLAELLNIRYEDAEKLRGINYRNLDHSLITLQDTVQPKKNFYISVEVLSPDSGVALYENALISYLSNNSYAKLQIGRRVNFLTNKIAWIKEELVKMDSLKNIVAASIIPRSKGQGIILGQPSDPMAIQAASEKLYTELIMFESEKNTMQNFDVIKGFVLSEKPSSPHKSIFWKLSLLAIVLGVVYSVVKNYSTYEKR